MNTPAAGTFRMTVNGKSLSRYFTPAQDSWALSHGFTHRLLSDVTPTGAPVRFTKTRAIVATDEGPYGDPVTETWEIRGLQFFTP